VGKYLRSIHVTDANGDEITVHEYEEREFLTKKHRFSLETGELVEDLDGGFVVITTGEMLTRVEGPRKSGAAGVGR
jgi:predicted HAD superfamily phosphohydrolase